MRTRTGSFLFLGLFMGLASIRAIAADPTPVTDEEYEKKIHAAQEVSPLGSDFTGEQVSLYDGSTTFSVTDVDLPGNNALPVRLGRRFKVEERRNPYLTGFGDWDIDLPRMEGVFAADRGWKLQGSAPYARCTSANLPEVIDPGSNVAVGPLDVWSGTNLYIPGQGSQELLINDQPKLPALQDGQSYPWVTSDFYRLRCLAQTANGYPGEAFVAVGPDGTEYTFDYAVTRGYQSIKTTNQGPGVVATQYDTVTGVVEYTVLRVRVSFLVTRVKDRFGNWVSYTYTGDHLTAIQASDGRLITLSWNGDLIQSVTANGRAWNYAYTPVTNYIYPATLARVSLPDGSAWTYNATGTLKPTRVQPIDGGQNTSCPLESDAKEDTNPYHLTVGHPSGATAVFDFEYGRTYRTHTPIKFCRLPRGLPHPIPYAAHYWDGYSLTAKTISGPGIAAQHWTYLRYDVGTSFYTSGAATDPCPTCQVSKDVVVTGPDGRYQRYKFGVMYGLNEGKLLKVERGSGTATPVSVTTTQYIDTAQVAAQRFPDSVGTSRNAVYSFGNRLRPVTQTLLVQDARAFQSAVTQATSVYDFDPFARTLKQIKSSDPYVAPQPPASAPTVSVPPTSTTGNYGISWTAIAGTTSYALDESLNGTGWARLQSANTTSQSVSGKDNGSYRYRVQACNSIGCGPYSTVSTAVVTLTVPATPTLMMSTSQAVQPMQVVWTAVSAITAYQLDASADQGASWSQIYSGTGLMMSYSQPWSSNYLYRVRACNANGCGANSAVRDVTVERDPCPTCLLSPVSNPSSSLLPWMRVPRPHTSTPIDADFRCRLTSSNEHGMPRWT